MAGISGISYQRYREQQDSIERRKKQLRNMRPWLVVLIRIVIIPVTLPIRLYRWIYYD